ncbi:MAG: hypothetical protein EXR49_03670 [Dehalococcoidia bacterium]|nr:hypothetical protein [Dehalococcoidia bacterium]
MDFLGIGPLELLLVIVVFLLVMGPDKVPGMAKKIGALVGQARQAVTEAKDAMIVEVDDIPSWNAAPEAKKEAASPDVSTPVQVSAEAVPALAAIAAEPHANRPMHG